MTQIEWVSRYEKLAISYGDSECGKMNNPKLDPCPTFLASQSDYLMKLLFQ